MKVAIVQQGMRTTTGTQDWTDASVTSDLAAAIFWSGQPSANATLTSQYKQGFGATDLVGNVCGAIASEDATASARVTSTMRTDACLVHLQPNSTIDTSAAYSSTLSNGVRINYTAAAATAYLANCLLISGTDMQVKVSSGVWAASTAALTVTHGHSGAPDAMIMLSNYGTTAMNQIQTGYGFTMSFWDGANSAGIALQNTSVAATSATAALIGTDFGHMITADTDRYSHAVTSVGASTFTITRSASPAQATAIFITFKKLAGTFGAKTSLISLPTAIGTASLISGVTVPPQVIFTIPTRLTASGSLVTDDSTGSFGIGVAANNGGVTNYGAWASTAKDNVASSVAKSRTDNAAALLSLDNTGAVSAQATVSSWDTGGVTGSFSVAPGSAFKALTFAFGLTSSASSASVTVDNGTAALTGTSIDSDIGAPWTEASLTLSGQTITLNVSGLSYSINVDTASVSLAGQTPVFDQGLTTATGALSFNGQSLALATSAIIPPGTPLSIWGGDLTIQKNWQYLAGLGYCGAFRMKTATNGLQVQLSAIDYVFKPGGVL